MKSIGSAIKLHRKAKGLKQYELAEKAGISKTAFSQIERGEAQPHKRNLEAICKVLEIDVVDMLLSTATNIELLQEVAKRMASDMIMYGMSAVEIDPDGPVKLKAVKASEVPIA